MSEEQKLVDDLAVALIVACDRFRKSVQFSDDTDTLMRMIAATRLSNEIEDWLMRKRAEWEARP
jgi:hypothetical protein